MSKWYRRRTGEYIRYRYVNDNRMVDSVQRDSNGKWRVYIDGEGGRRAFKTRLEATSALDGYIRQPKPEKPQEKPEPQENSEALTECDGCGGSGRFRAGRVENGKFVGFDGKCYRCDGKGKQTAADRKRNQYYDNHVRKIHA